MPKRLPQPSVSERGAKQSEIEKIYSLSRPRTVSQKRELAKTLLSTAEETNDDPAGRFVLFDLAREFAARSGQLDESLAVAERIEREYEVDGNALRVDSLRRAAAATGVPAALKKAFVVKGEEIVERCKSSDAYDDAVAAVDALIDLSRRIRDRESLVKLVEQQKSLKQLQAQFAPVTSARKELQADPTNAAANAVVGRFLAFEKGDWQGAMPHLSKGEDEPLLGLARSELNPPESAAGQLRLADGWWDYGNSLADLGRQKQALSRAAGWYAKSGPKLALLSRGKAKRRVEELAARGIKSADLAVRGASPGTNAFPLLNDNIRDARWYRGSPIDVLPWLELPRDQVSGDWTLKDGKLISPVAKFARVRLPMIPPREFELRVMVEPLAANKNFVLTLPGMGGARFVFQVQGHAKFRHSGVERIAGKTAQGNETNFQGEVLRPGQVNELVIQVRDSHIRASVNSREIVDWRGDFRRLSADKGWEDPGRSAIVIGAYLGQFAVHLLWSSRYRPQERRSLTR